MKKIYLMLLFIIFTFSCGGKQGQITYVVKPQSTSKIERVAVLPFMNYSEDKFAGEKARDFVITALLEKGIDVVPKAVVDREVKRLGIPAGFYFDINDFKVLADTLKVDGFVQGSVDEYRIERKGSYSYPVVGLTIKIINTNGNIVWQATGVKSYYSTIGRLFGLKSIDPIVALNNFVYKLFDSFSPQKFRIEVENEKK